MKTRTQRALKFLSMPLNVKGQEIKLKKNLFQLKYNTPCEAAKRKRKRRKNKPRNRRFGDVSGER